MSFWDELLVLFRALFRTQPADVPEAEPPATLRSRVLLIVYKPSIPSEGGQPLNQVLGWNDPDVLVEQYIADLRETSGGGVDYQIAQRIEVDDWPVKKDGFRYDGDGYVQCYRSRSGWHEPDAVDYEAIIDEFDLLARVNADQIDEVWLSAFPHAGFYESYMVGPGAFWCNSPPMRRNDVDRRFVIMGFSYERGVGEMLESWGHRVESHLEQVWRGFGDDPARNLWKRFILYDKVAPGQAHCGNVHFAPNSQRDYDWGNRTLVPSYCDDWLHFPDFQDRVRQVNCEEWGNGDTRLHHRWWLAHLPKVAGRTQGIANNWWWYVVDPNAVE